MRLAIPCAILVLALAGCTTDERPETPNARSFTEVDGCSNQEQATSLTPQTSTEADVDGDGETDPVMIVMRENAEPGCRAFVAAFLQDRTASEPVWEIGREGGLPEPRLNAFVEIDGEPGLEILVDELAGASTQFVGAFTFVDGALERIEPAEPGEDLWAGAAQGVFPYGGSVGHVEAVDCAGDGEIVVSVALPGDTPRKVERSIYKVTRRFFEVSGTELLEIRTEEEEVAFEFGETYPEFGSSPFGSCPAA